MPEVHFIWLHQFSPRELWMLSFCGSVHEFSSTSFRKYYQPRPCKRNLAYLSLLLFKEVLRNWLPSILQKFIWQTVACWIVFFQQMVKDSHNHTFLSKPDKDMIPCDSTPTKFTIFVSLVSLRYLVWGFFGALTIIGISIKYLQNSFMTFQFLPQRIKIKL